MSSHQLLLALLLLFSGLVSIVKGQENNEPHEQTVVIAQPLVRTKVLAQGYEKLCDAIEADDIKTVGTLFKEYPGLKAFSYQPAGSPLHFVRSLAMAQYLTKHAGFSVNVCDEWGETPSYAIAHSKHNRFPSREEQQAIAAYFKKHEVTYAKCKHQLFLNKNLHMKLSIVAMTGILASQFAWFVTMCLKNIRTLKGA